MAKLPHTLVYKLAILTVGLALALFLIVANKFEPGGRRIIKIGGIDAVAYYGTAHSLLFDRDFDLTNQYAVLKPSSSHFMMVRPETGLPGSAWAIGYSLLEIPFLAVGTAIDALSGRPADGYASGAMIAYYLGHIVFVTIGLLCVFDFLGQVAAHALPTLSEGRRNATNLIVTLALLPATSLGYYAFSPMAHAAGFMSVALFARAWMWARDTEKLGRWAAAGLFGGLVTLCRWQNLLLLLAPLIADALAWRPENWRRPAIRSWLKMRFLFIAVAMVCLVPQFIQWKVIYGRYLLNPQGDHIFQFPPRSIALVLLSTWHGWLIWTPAIALCLAGLLWGCFEKRHLFLPWTIVLGLEIAVIGSLPTRQPGGGPYWSLGISFGIRTLTCMLPIAAMGLSYLLLRTAPAWRGVLWGALAVATAYTVVFAVQYRLDLVPDDDYLTFSELITDKIALRRAYQRRRLVNRCQEVIAENHPQDCIQILEEGSRRFGEDRFLLTTLAAAHHATGDERAEAAARLRLQAFLDKRLW
jgi:hypothetical protein